MASKAKILVRFLIEKLLVGIGLDLYVEMVKRGNMENGKCRSNSWQYTCE